MTHEPRRTAPNVVELNPEANAIVLQIAAARAQLAQDVSEKLKADFEHFRVEVRASLHVNADLTAQAISKLEAAASKCDRISGRLADRLTVLEGRALQRNSSDEIVVSLAESAAAERKLEIEQDRLSLERERLSVFAKEKDREAEAEARKATREHRWAVVKMWSASSTGVAVLLAAIALISKAC